MKSEALLTPASTRRALLDLYEWAREIRLAYAWVSARGAPIAHWEALPLEKITRAVVGTHFDRTDPTPCASFIDEAPRCACGSSSRASSTRRSSSRSAARRLAR